MTEDEWLACREPEKMYSVIREVISTRQARLLMSACCRLLEDQFFDPRIPSVLEAAERCADDQATEAAANALWDQWMGSPSPPDLPQTGPHGDLGRAITAAWDLVASVPNEPTWEEPFSNARAALASAVLMCMRDQPRQVFTGGEGDAVWYCLRAVDAAWRKEGAVADVGQAALLRDTFGPLPFRPVPFSPAFRTSAVTSLATAMYESNCFDAAPILADALEEAECESADILNHLRGGGVHVRGCWAVDLVLGKD